MNVSAAPALTVSPVFPALRRTVTVTFADGAADSDTPNTSPVPCATENRCGATTRRPADAAGARAAVAA